LLECFFCADAFDFVTEIERPIIFAQDEVSQRLGPGANKQSEVALLILHVPNRFEAGLDQFIFSDFPYSVDGSHREST
jgi:hypothetical protein